MPDNRSLWSDGPSEDEHHGWLDPDRDAPADEPTVQSRAERPEEEPTKAHQTGRLTPRAPREGPSAWDEFRGRLVWPLVALCVAALLVGGIAIGTQVVGERTVERTVVAGNSGGATSSQIKAAYEATHDGVVFIRTAEGSGSGWVYDDKGTIVTNNHVVADANGNVRVRFTDDGELIPAKVLGTDVSSDLAVLRVDPKDVSKLVPLKIAESNDVQTGDPVIAIGYPLGLDQTTTAGIISGVGRQIQAQNNFSIDKVLQTDAPINPGNSGGPLLNTKGEVVGVNSQIATTGAGGGSVGIGFAIPSDTVRDIVPRLENGQTIPHAYLGVQVAALAQGEGAAVAVVTPGGPAERANLQPSSGSTTTSAAGGVSNPDGDVIKKIDGTAVNSPDDVTRVVNDHKPGDEITLDVERKGSTREVKVTLADRPKASSSTGTPTLTIPTTPSSPSIP